MKKISLWILVIMIMSLPGWGYAQELKELWESTTDSISGDEVLKIVYANSGELKKIENKHVKSLLSAAKKIQVLDKPDTRSLPSIEGMLVFFMKNTNMLVIQITQKHWFKAVYFNDGQVIPFILKDNEDGLYQVIEKLFAPPELPKEPLCNECQGKMFIMAIGTCSNCGSSTPSMAYKLCAECARAKGVCMSCGRKAN